MIALAIMGTLNPCIQRRVYNYDQSILHVTTTMFVQPIHTVYQTSRATTLLMIALATMGFINRITNAYLLLHRQLSLHAPAIFSAQQIHTVDHFKRVTSPLMIAFVIPYMTEQLPSADPNS